MVFCITAALSWCTLRHGLELGPDAWQYWSASVSLLEGRGYVDGHGLSVQGWPPGYSIWLAVWQACLGISVGTICVAESFAIGWTAAMVTAWALLRMPATAPRWPVVVAAIAACLAAARGVGSERLMLGLLFTGLTCIEVLRGARSWRYFSLLMALTGCCIGMALVRHAALAFLPGMWFLLMGPSSRGVVRATLTLLAVVAATMCAWMLSRMALDQDSEVWFSGVHRVNALLGAMVSGIDRGIAPWPVGLGLFLATWLAFGPLRSRVAPLLGLSVERLRHGDVALFVLSSLAALFAMYLLVYVADLPGPRFVRFASIATAVLLAAVVSQITKPRLRWVLLVLVLAPNVVYAAKHVLVGRRSVTSLNEAGGSSFLPKDAVPGPRDSQELRLPNGQLRVPEPLFRWQRERLEERERRLRGEGR